MVKLRGLNSKLSKLKLTSGQKHFLGMADHFKGKRGNASRTIGRFGKTILRKKKRGWKNPSHF